LHEQFAGEEWVLNSGLGNGADMLFLFSMEMTWLIG